MSKQVFSARGRLVDLELLQLQQSLAAPDVVVAPPTMFLEQMQQQLVQKLAEEQVQVPQEEQIAITDDSKTTKKSKSV